MAEGGKRMLRRGCGEGKKVVVRKVVSRQAVSGKAGAKPRTAVAGAAVKSFDGSVYGFAVSGETLYAATSEGLLRSASSGVAWNVAASIPMDEYRFLAAAKSYVVAASLDTVELSVNGGDACEGGCVASMPKVTQVSALSVDGQGGVWVAGREGVYYSADKGANWQTLDGLFVRIFMRTASFTMRRPTGFW